MRKPRLPEDEAERLAALRALNLLDTLPEERFDRFTRLGRRLFSVPIALLSLVDAERQWFKSRQGLEARETPRDISFCGHAILHDEILVVPDARFDERFSDNPLVVGEPRIRFYAGRPIHARSGHRIGTLCLIDQRPRSLSEEERALLNDLARMVEDEIAALELASTDELTGLSNRRGFLEMGVKALALCDRIPEPATLLFFDLDGFKEINDRFGHAEGDRVLCDFASLLLDCFRDSDVVARLGGDEFCVLLTGAGERDVARPLARLKRQVAVHNAGPRDYELRYSVGVLSREEGRGEPLPALLEEADQRMYQHKRGVPREAPEGADNLVKPVAG